MSQKFNKAVLEFVSLPANLSKKVRQERMSDALFAVEQIKEMVTAIKEAVEEKQTNCEESFPDRADELGEELEALEAIECSLDDLIGEWSYE